MTYRSTATPPPRNAVPTPASVLNDDCLHVLSVASGLSPDATSTRSAPASVFNDLALAVLAQACESGALERRWELRDTAAGATGGGPWSAFLKSRETLVATRA